VQEVKNIPDVKKFPEVFPKNLLGLPLERVVEFAIELQSGTPITLEVVRWTKIWNRDFGGPLSYKVQLPENLSTVPNIFHVYQLKRFLRVLEHVLEISNVNLQSNLTYSEHSIKVWIKRIGPLEESYQVLQDTVEPKHTEDQATWELEENLEKHVPEFLVFCKP
jgi:hypothetical protein